MPPRRFRLSVYAVSKIIIHVKFYLGYRAACCLGLGALSGWGSAISTGHCHGPYP